MILVIDELAPGMNTLLRMHFRDYGKLRDKWQWMVRNAAGTRTFGGSCEVRIDRYYAKNKMDLDNLWSTAKIPLDALVRSGILPGDHPEVLGILMVKQFKVNTVKEERTEIAVRQFAL